MERFERRVGQADQTLHRGYLTLHPPSNIPQKPSRRFRPTFSHPQKSSSRPKRRTVSSSVAQWRDPRISLLSLPVLAVILSGAKNPCICSLPLSVLVSP